MLCTCYLRRGVVYVPTMAQVEPRAGHKLVEQVAVMPISDSAAVKQALQETIARGNPSVPMRSGRDFPKPILPKYAGVRGWSAFERDAST